MQQKKIIIILLIIVAIAAALTTIYLISPELFKSITQKIGISGEKPKIIEETLTIPETKNVSETQGRFVIENNVQVPLVPKNEGEKIIAPQAVLTIKQSYDLTLTEAQNWSQDQKLSFIKSLGVLTLEGKSSGWQLIFNSEKKKIGYEIIIQSGQIASKKEVQSDAKSADIPSKWKDLGEVIKELQTHPIYQDATISGVSFHINPDDMNWYYAISTSKGVSAITVE